MKSRRNDIGDGGGYGGEAILTTDWRRKLRAEIRDGDKQRMEVTRQRQKKSCRWERAFLRPQPGREATDGGSRHRCAFPHSLSLLPPKPIWPRRHSPQALHLGQSRLGCPCAAPHHLARNASRHLLFGVPSWDHPIDPARAKRGELGDKLGRHCIVAPAKARPSSQISIE